MSKALVVDPSKCTSCRSCEVACSIAKEGEANLSKSRIKLVLFRDDYFYFPVVCLQCETPFCALPCPTGALVKDPDSGVVQLKADKCMGCKWCLISCPFGAITLVDGRAAKCDLCDGDPACVRFCEVDALRYADSHDIGEARRIELATRVKGSVQVVASP